ncbi:putative Alpha/beta hydrolase fold-3 domain-containing protein [Seiridium cardinale]
MAPSPWSSQPLKAIYIVCFWAINIPHLLFLSLKYTIAPLRAVPQWSYKISMGAAIMRAFFRYLGKIRFQQPLQLSPGHKSDGRFVLIPPPEPSLVRGVLSTRAAATKLAPVGAVWHPAPITPGSTNTNLRVIIYAAGGAFVLGWDPEQNAETVSAVATEHFGATNVLYMQYRLASEENPFPAAVQDFFTTYQYVLDLGVAPSDIVVMGDSAGANIVLALLRYLAEEGLPQPGGAVVFSPWVEVTSEAVERYDRSISRRYDILDVPLLEWGVDAYRPRGKILKQEEEAYISPLNHPFRLEAPLFIDSGSLEGFYESISTFAKQMADVRGNRIQFNTSMDLPHDFFLTDPVLGTKEEACTVLRQAKTFLDGQTN